MRVVKNLSEMLLKCCAEMQETRQVEDKDVTWEARLESGYLDMLIWGSNQVS